MKIKLIVLLLHIVYSCNTQAHTINLTNGEWAPYSSKKLKNNGAYSHIVEKAFNLVNIKVKWGFYSWSRGYKLAEQGIDWHGSLLYVKNAEREELFYFSSPIGSSTGNFFHLENTKFEWEKFDDLEKYKIGLTKGYGYGIAFDEYRKNNNMQIHISNTDEVNFKKLLNNKIEAFPIDLEVGLQIMNKYNRTNTKKITYHQKPYADVPLHLIITKRYKNAGTIIQKFNEGIAKLKDSGEYFTILKNSRNGKYN